MMANVVQDRSWALLLILNVRLANRVFNMPFAFMPFLRLIAAFVALSLVQVAWAVTPFTVEDIRVEGLQRV